jgi:hypothetical protein
VYVWWLLLYYCCVFFAHYLTTVKATAVRIPIETAAAELLENCSRARAAATTAWVEQFARDGDLIFPFLIFFAWQK